MSRRRDYNTVPNADLPRVQEAVRTTVEGLGDVAWAKVISVDLEDGVEQTIAHGLGSVPRAVIICTGNTGHDVWESQQRDSQYLYLTANVFSGGTVSLDVLVF